MKQPLLSPSTLPPDTNIRSLLLCHLPIHRHGCFHSLLLRHSLLPALSNRTPEEADHTVCPSGRRGQTPRQNHRKKTLLSRYDCGLLLGLHYSCSLPSPPLSGVSRVSLAPLLPRVPSLSPRFVDSAAAGSSRACTCAGGPAGLGPPATPLLLVCHHGTTNAKPPQPTAQPQTSQPSALRCFATMIQGPRLECATKCGWF